MKIPINNIYYLLSYAYDKLEAEKSKPVGLSNDAPTLDLLTVVLINAVSNLFKRGIKKGYVDCEEEIIGIKGKLNLGSTIKQNLLLKGATLCLVDNYTEDIISNQIIKATIKNVLRMRVTTSIFNSKLRGLNKMLYNVCDINLSYSIFNKVKCNKNERQVKFVIDICKLIFINTIPSENSDKLSFSDFVRDEKKMNSLFESFVRNFYKQEQKIYSKVKAETMKWNFTSESEGDLLYLPNMITDITLESEHSKIIMDTKFYKESLSNNYNTERVHSTNLYQLFSYIKQQECDTPKTKKVKGILLYPNIKKELNLHYKFEEHELWVKTVDLSKDWHEIHSRLLEIVIP